VHLSLLANYQLGGLDPWGYHLVNLLVHLASVLTLWALLRRGLRHASVPASVRGRGDLVAFFAAAWWGLHPLTTQAVTYVIQRAEALSALFALLTLYGVATRRRGLAVAACALGMASKPTGATAPLAALLWDAFFVSGSFRAALRQEWRLYAGLASTWLLLAALLRAAELDASAGPALEAFGPFDYLLTQPGVILHYLRLAAFPDALVLDYAWPLARGWREIAPPALVLLLLLLAGLRAWWRRQAAGLALVLFFLWLGPSSSVMPIKDLAFEHRMYLPLAPLCALAAGALAWLLARLGWGALLVWVGLGAALALGIRTDLRNRDYASPERLWTSALSLRPDNPRVHNQLALALLARGADRDAGVHFRRALELEPQQPGPLANLAAIAIARGDLTEAAAALRAFEALDPEDEALWINWGRLRHAQGRPEDAIRCYRRALEIAPHSELAPINLSQVLIEIGRPLQALEFLERAQQLRPDSFVVLANLGTAYHQLGRFDEAIAAYESARPLASGDPRLPELQVNLGNTLAEAGRPAEARRAYAEALRLAPGYPRAVAALRRLEAPESRSPSER
jgi:Flp pilus assembly protein TadD